MLWFGLAMFVIKLLYVLVLDPILDGRARARRLPIDISRES